MVPNDEKYFLYLGKIVGKALLENWNLDVNFSKCFLKHILRKNLNFKDLEDIDPELSRNLMWILENNIQGGDDLLI